MDNEESKEMSTKNKINLLINDIQNKLSKRTTNNPLSYNTLYKNSNTLNNNYINIPSPSNNNYCMPKTAQNFSYQNPNLNEYNLRKMIQDEFSMLILPYQKDLITTKNNFDKKSIDIEKKFEYIINAQNFGNLNDNAKIISTYLNTNLSNDNTNKNLEIIKNEYNKKFEDLDKKINYISEQVKLINEEKINNEKKFENFGNKIENLKKILEKKEDKDDTREIKIYLEKNTFDKEINKLKEKINNNNNEQNQTVLKLNEQIDNMSKLINQFKLEINKINNLDSNINSIRGEFGKIKEDISSLKYQISPDIIEKINSIDFNKLKQQVSLIEFNKIKNDLNNFENNFYSVKNISENNDRNISDMKTQINDIEQKQNSINKTLEEKISDKIKEINIKLEEISKKEKEKEKEEKKEEISINNNNNEKNNEEEPDIFIGSSRRQQRNSKSINKAINNDNKNKNNLDEKTMNLIKQLEKINLDELQEINFNNLLNQVGDLSRENKILSDKIEEQNKIISQINEKINNINLNIKNNQKEKENIINEFKLDNILKKSDLNIKEPKIDINNINNIDNKLTPKKDSFIEDDYDDFDKDINSNKKEEITEKENIENNDNKNNLNNLLDDKEYRNDILKKSKNEYGSFSKYSEVNILDQIMGIGDKDKKQGFDIGYSEPKFGGGSTFITGSLTDNKKFNFNEKPPIFEEDNNKNENNENKNDELNNKKEEEKKEDNNDDDFDDDFDVDEI